MKKIICLIISLVFSFNLIVPSASGLYSNYFIKKLPLSVGLDYLNYKGEDASAYSQNVHILDYSPSADTLPIVSFGKSQLSHKTVSSMVKNQKNAVAGVNGDFFSFTTGIPMSAVISDGIVLSSDAGNNAMGITEDFDVIFGKPEIRINISHSYIPVPDIEEAEQITQEVASEETVEPADSADASTDVTPVETIPSEEPETVISEDEATTNEESITDSEADVVTEPDTEIADAPTDPEITDTTEPEPITLDFSVYYNKYPTVYAVYMTDSSYSDSTASTFDSLEIVVRGDKPVKIGEEITLTVEDVLADTMDTAIPEGAMVITVPNVLKGFDSYKAIKKGDTLKMTVTSAEGWESVKTAVGGTDIFVKDGAFVPETVDEDHEKYRNARTAVGLREDGSLFFVAVDGDGKSGAGMSMSALGEFMIGEGAVTAFNLDGGGSTTVAVSFPSENEIKVLNSVKDKSERRVSNSVLFINNSSDSEDIGFADLGLSDSYLLAGSRLEIKPTLFTKSRGISASEYSVTYKASTEGTVLENGIYTPLDATYNDRIFATFVIADTTLEADGYINVTNTLDAITLNKKAILVEEGNTFTLEIKAERFGMPVTSTLDAFTYTDTSLTLSDDEDSETEDNEDAETPVEEIPDTETEASEVTDEEGQPVTEDAEITVEDAQTDTEAIEDKPINLFENEYITLSPDGTVTVKSAPLFTRLDLAVSYKDTESVLTFYFGRPDEIIESFDDNEYRDRVFSPEYKLIVDGYRSERGVLVSDGIISYKETVPLDIIPKYFTVYVKEGYRSGFNLVLQDGDEQVFIPYYIYKDYSSVTGWTQLIAIMPDSLSDKAFIVSPILDLDAGSFTIDDFTAHYGYEVDPFEDISGLWSYDYIMQIYDMGLINGYVEDDRTIFKPDNNITRAEFAKMLASYLALDLNGYTAYGTEFSDADAIAEWSSSYIKALSTEGYMNGKSNPDGTITFDPNAFITREEAMHVFSKLLTSDSFAELEFSDSDLVHDWALDSVKKVVGAGIVTGFDDGTLRAQAPVTRAQMCTMFTRIWNNK